MVVPASGPPRRRLLPEAASKKPEVVMNSQELQRLYDATAEDFRYGIGVMRYADSQTVPVILTGFSHTGLRRRLRVPGL